MQRTALSHFMPAAISGILLLSSWSFTSFAEPVGPNPVTNQAHPNSEGSPAESTQPLEPMNISQPTAEPSKAPAFFYPYQQSLSLTVGPFWEPNSPAGLYGMFGINYLAPSTTNFHWDFGMESIGIGEGHLWAAARWNRVSTEQFRPYYSLGAGVRLIGVNGLATFLQLSDYFVRAAAGIEYSVTQQDSVTSELSLASDFQGDVFMILSFGYSFGL